MDRAREVVAFWSGIFAAGTVAVVVGFTLVLALPATLGAGLLAASAVSTTGRA
jgi:hypothetical protein